MFMFRFICTCILTFGIFLIAEAIAVVVNIMVSVTLIVVPSRVQASELLSSLRLFDPSGSGRLSTQERTNF